jgi:hypothetical protein
VLLNVVAKDGVGWNYRPLDGLILYSKQTATLVDIVPVEGAG